MVLTLTGRIYGAGKTTTVEIIETIRTPTSGKVSLLGMDVTKKKRKIFADFFKIQRKTCWHLIVRFMLSHIKNITEQINEILLKAETDLRQVISEAAQWQVVLKKCGWGFFLAQGKKN